MYVITDTAAPAAAVIIFTAKFSPKKANIGIVADMIKETIDKFL